MSEFDCSPSDVLLVADQIARRMAHRWAQRKGLAAEIAETVLDEALPILWSQRVERVPLDMGELYAKALALVSVQKGRKIQYDNAVLERKALAWWSVLRSPRSQFVGDDGSDYAPVSEMALLGDAPPVDHVALAQLGIAARVQMYRLIGYSPMREAAAYHA